MPQFSLEHECVDWFSTFFKAVSPWSGWSPTRSFTCDNWLTIDVISAFDFHNCQSFLAWPNKCCSALAQWVSPCQSIGPACQCSFVSHFIRELFIGMAVSSTMTTPRKLLALFRWTGLHIQTHAGNSLVYWPDYISTSPIGSLPDSGQINVFSGPLDGA